MEDSILKRFTGDIRVWIIFFFLLRLYGITNPPLETSHNWRQTTVTMVARNFLEKDNNIFYPRIDFAGEKTGITGMEFPFLNYLIYLCSLVFGYGHWYGRLINLLISSLGLYYFYLLIRKYFQGRIAFMATIFLLLSVWFTFSRKIMPDTFSMSLITIGFYYGSNYLDKVQSVRNLLLYALFTLLGVLSKLPSGYILILYAFFLFNKEITFRAKVYFSVVTACIGTVISVFYFYWVPYLTKQYEFSHFFMGKNMSVGLTEIMGNLNDTLEKFYLEALGYSGFLIFILGLVFIIYKNQKKLIYLFTLATIGFLAIVLKSGLTFYAHDYYIIPFAPVMALIAAYGMEQIQNKKVIVLTLCLFTIESIARKNIDFYIKEENKAIIQLEEVMDRLGSRNDLVAINSGAVPTPMYFSHRKGWVENNEQLSNGCHIAKLKSKGLKFIIILKRAFGRDVILPYKQIFDNADFRIYRLDKFI